MEKIKIKSLRWNLNHLYKNESDLKNKTKLLEKSYRSFINKWKNRKDYLEDPKVLKEALDEYESLLKNFGGGGDEAYYCELNTWLDQNNTELKAKYNKIKNFLTKLGNEIQFFTMRLAKVPEKTQEKFLNDNSLKDYRHFLRKLFEEAKYLLSEEEEKILNLKSKTSFDNWMDMVSAFLAKQEREILLSNGKKSVKNFSEIMNLINDVDKKTRDSAADAFNDILKNQADVAEHEMNSILEDKKVDDELRKLPRPDYSRHLGDDIDTGVVDALIKAVSERYDIAKRYYKLKARLMKVKKLKYHERSVPYGKFDKKYSYEDAINLVNKVFRGLDREFSDILLKFIENGNIDVYPANGKMSGAYCIHSGILQPTYILLNHDDTLKSVSTIAHEAGHGINNELIKKKQNAINFGSPTSTAEVASTFMEDFVIQELLKEADDELKLAIMMEKLNDEISSITRQVAFYKFEWDLHKLFREKGYLSKEEIGGLFRKHMESYMGNYVEQTKGSENWWIHVIHFRYMFYVYSYASGLLISKSLQNSVKKNPAFIAKVKEFLASGSSESPKNIFKKLGIDITDRNFWNKGLDELENLLKETEKLAKKLKKI